MGQAPGPSAAGRPEMRAPAGFPGAAATRETGQPVDRRSGRDRVLEAPLLGLDDRGHRGDERASGSPSPSGAERARVAQPLDGVLDRTARSPIRGTSRVASARACPLDGQRRGPQSLGRRLAAVDPIERLGRTGAGERVVAVLTTGSTSHGTKRIAHAPIFDRDRPSRCWARQGPANKKTAVAVAAASPPSTCTQTLVGAGGAMLLDPRGHLIRRAPRDQRVDQRSLPPCSTIVGVKPVRSQLLT